MAVEITMGGGLFGDDGKGKGSSEHDHILVLNNVDLIQGDIDTDGAEYIVQHAGELKKTVYPVPEAIDTRIAALKLKAMGIEIDLLTPEQARYLASWEEGT